MAHFSELKNESDVNKVEIRVPLPQACRDDGFFVKTDLRCLFDQVLSYFLKWVSVNKNIIEVFPPKLGDGVEADLFTLFWVVRKLGDYELVSKFELWEFVAEECGLDITHVGSLKLIYIKYLKELDQWLSHAGFDDIELENGEVGVLQKLASSFRELKGCKCSVEYQINKGQCVIIDNGNTKKLDLDMTKTETVSVSKMNNGKISSLDGKRTELSREIVVKKVDVSRIKDDNDNEKRVVLRPSNVLNESERNLRSDSENDTVNLSKSIVEKVVSSHKRKKGESLSLAKMLDWVANAARNPHDVAIGSIPSSSKWKKYKSNEAWKQVLVVKETLFAKRNRDSGNEVYGLQKKRHMMHPSMYEDDKLPIHLSSKRIRCSQRVSSTKACSCPGCISCSSSRNKRHIRKPLQIPESIEIPDDECADQETGSVTVPKWTGVIYESDPKWLGTRMWPPPDGRHEMDLGVIGKGRRSWCRCRFPGSAGCVRFHVAKSRRRVKQALGPLFYKWKFNRMGEEASVSWSLEEETEFKSLVIKARQELRHRNKSRHEIMSNFWRRASESIPSKTKDVMVSYYFNVFVLRRRSYQNRIMPENIDSDDDELEVGSGYE